METVGEFKAWLEGFEEGMAGKAPNKAQWTKIKQRLGEVTEPVPAYTPYYYPWPWTHTPWTIWTNNGETVGNTGTFTTSNAATGTYISMGEQEAIDLN